MKKLIPQIILGICIISVLGFSNLSTGFNKNSETYIIPTSKPTPTTITTINSTQAQLLTTEHKVDNLNFSINKLDVQVKRTAASR